MRTFVLVRSEDVTGVSGTGVVAEGVEFVNGKVAIQWIVGDHQSTVIWDSIDSAEVIHGHNGETEIVFYEHDILFNYDGFQDPETEQSWQGLVVLQGDEDNEGAYDEKGNPIS